MWARTGDEWRPLEQSPRPVPIGIEVPQSGPSGKRLRAGELPPHLVGLERTQHPASIARNCDSRRRELAAGAPIQSLRGRDGGAGRAGPGLGHEGGCRDLPLAPSEPRTDDAGTRRVHARSTTAPTKPTWPTVESPVSQRFQQRPTTALHGSVRHLKAVARVRIPSGLPIEALCLTEGCGCGVYLCPKPRSGDTWDTPAAVRDRSSAFARRTAGRRAGVHEGQVSSSRTLCPCIC